MEPYVEGFIRSADIASPDLRQRERAAFAKEQGASTFRSAFPYLLLGAGIGALIRNWIPQAWIERLPGSENPFGILLATPLGIPIYADIVGTIPVAEAPLLKGAQLGALLSFMIAVTTLPLPSLILPHKAVKPKLLALFAAACTFGILLAGYLFHAFKWLLISF